METPRCLIVTQDRFLGRLMDLLLDHGEYERRRVSDAREARRALEDITGARTAEDVLRSIFDKFCIGK